MLTGETHVDGAPSGLGKGIGRLGQFRLGKVRLG